MGPRALRIDNVLVAHKEQGRLFFLVSARRVPAEEQASPIVSEHLELAPFENGGEQLFKESMKNLEGPRIARLLDRPHANHARKLLGISALSRRPLVTFHHSIASFSNTASTKRVSATEEGWRYAAGFTNF